jgi:phosphoglycerol transferase MdoB-like AlkP superfamily enzyme
MRAASLLGVLVLAKVLWLIEQPGAFGAWGLVAYFSQDVLVAALAWVIDAACRRPRAGWIVYGAAVAYIALNVPVAVVLGSPLTLPMLRATGGALSDSITYYLTWGNVARITAIVGAGIALPFVAGEPKGSPLRVRSIVFAAVAIAFIALGPLASRRVDTAGRDRNAFTALLPIGLPAAAASPAVADLRRSPIPVPFDSPALGDYRGSARGMNVLVVILESTAARYLKPYGAAHDPMPNLTKLSERALLFENAYSVYPESIKGLFATLCSRYPLFNEPAEVHATMPCASLGETLRRSGYRTGLFHSGRFAYLGMQEILANKGFDALEDAGAIGGNVHSSFGVDEPAAVERILKWIDSGDQGRPFFAAYLPIAGHHPYATPVAGPFAGDDVFTQYENALYFGDAALGTLLDGLRARQLDRRTAIVVFGDHGEAFGQHPGNIGHTLFIHEENMRVPYLIVVPGATERTQRVPGVASLIDTAPTVLDLLGMPRAPEHDGRSLLSPGSRMALFFTDYSLGWLGLRDACWKYQLETNSGRSTLFDVCRDAGETQDVSATEAERARAYRDRVTTWAGTLKRSAPSP